MSSTAIVTGAATGIGYAVTERLLASGHHVVMGGRSRDALEEAWAALGSPDQSTIVVGDIAHPDTAERLVAAATAVAGTVDVLVNNAGIFGATPFVDVTSEELDGYIDINLRGTWRVTQAVVRHVVGSAQASASIVNIGTVLNQHAIAGFPAAAPLVTKGAVQAMTIALAAELAPHGIRVNMVAPGIIRTPLHPADEVDGMAGLAVLDRVGEAAELADAVAWLARAGFVTGHVLNVDGGFVTARS